MNIAISRINKWINKTKLSGDENKFLDLSDLELTELPILPINLKYLDCSYNLLKSLPILPNKLEQLYCNNNNIKKINNLPDTLQNLICDRNDIYELDISRTKLKKVSCNHNNLTKFNSPNTLIELDCGFNYLTTLNNLFFGLQILICDKNKIKKLEYLPTSLLKLNCNKNKIKKLDNLPNLLIKLHCSYNRIEELNNLPNLLIELDCSNNKIKELNYLPISLTELDCSNNELISLTLSNDLLYLNCSNNELTSLNISSLLNTLYCKNNKLIYPIQVPFTVNETDLKTDQYTLVEPISLTDQELEEKQYRAQTILEQKQREEKDQVESHLKRAEELLKLEPVKEKKRKVSENEEKILHNRCNNKENIIGDDLDIQSGIIAIILPTDNKYIVYCYEYEEIDNILDQQEQLYEWKTDINRPTWIGEPILNKRVYKEAYLGLWLDSTSKELIHKYNTFIVKPFKQTKIGSGFGSSQLHGEEYTIYKLHPVSVDKLLLKEKITDNDITNFKPTSRDMRI